MTGQEAAPTRSLRQDASEAVENLKSMLYVLRGSRSPNQLIESLMGEVYAHFMEDLESRRRPPIRKPSGKVIFLEEWKDSLAF